MSVHVLPYFCPGLVTVPGVVVSVTDRDHVTRIERKESDQDLTTDDQHLETRIEGENPDHG